MTYSSNLQNKVIQDAVGSSPNNIQVAMNTSSIDPIEVEKFLRFVKPTCHTCGTIIGHLGDRYFEHLSQGGKADKFFSSHGLDNYCCRSSLANPARLPPGIIYNNPRVQGKVEFVTEQAEKLLDQLTINNDPSRGAIISVSIPSLASNELNEATEIQITQPISTSMLPTTTTSSTAIPQGTTLSNTNEEEDIIVPETSEINSSYFSSDFNNQFKSTVNVPSSIPQIPESQGILKPSLTQPSIDQTSNIYPGLTQPSMPFTQIPGTQPMPFTQIPGTQPITSQSNTSFIGGFGPRINKINTTTSLMFGSSNAPDTSTIISDTIGESISNQDDKYSISSMVSGIGEGPTFGKNTAPPPEMTSSYIYTPQTSSYYDSSLGRLVTVRQYS